MIGYLILFVIAIAFGSCIMFHFALKKNGFKDNGDLLVLTLVLIEFFILLTAALIIFSVPEIIKM